MKRLWLAAVAASALTTAANAQEHEVCLDQTCSTVSILDLDSDSAAAETVDTATPKFGTWGVDVAAMDRAADPGDSFNRFANGKGLDTLVIPADRTSWGSFAALRELSDNRIRALIDELAAKPNATGDEAKIADFYRSFMDAERVERLDAAPLAADLRAIREADTRSELAQLMGRSLGGFGRSFFSAFVNEDSKRPNINVVFMSQSGLGLPDRDYYLVDRFKTQRAAYQDYVQRMLTMAAWPDAKARAADILALETRIAEASWTRAESRDRDKTYNPVTVAELQRLAPAFAWRPFLQAANLQGGDRIILSQSTAFPKLAAIFADTPVETLQAWQAFHTVDSAAPYLSNRFVNANWEFRQKTLSGQPEQRSRVKRAVTATDAALGDPLGRLYTARYFPPESKAKMEALVADLKAALKVRIDGLAWMSPETKVQAQDKLAKFNVNIGYSPLVRDYADLQVDPTDLYGNIKRSQAHEWVWNSGRLQRPVDPNDWGRPPQTVNAWYRANHNDITFPAAILQPPFFDPEADPAVNYGGIGGVIGHEISHGFDDQGRKVDGNGVLRDWWTAEDAAKFQVQADRLGAQYDTYTPIPGDPAVKVNGKLTMGENIGDLGGLLMALDAYRLSLDGKPAPVIDGLTGDQRVFLGWAQVWRTKARDEALRQQVVTDPHSPAQFRVDGVVRNIDAWYEAFGVTPDDDLYLPPERRVRIW
ncbi:MAG TPA: M13-type metalloendopeptidase [Caulobacteraceae bacterium]|jgi:putative endopeptidase